MSVNIQDSVGTLVSRFSILPISAIVEIVHILKSTLPKGRFVDVGIKLSLKIKCPPLTQKIT